MPTPPIDAVSEMLDLTATAFRLASQLWLAMSFVRLHGEGWILITASLVRMIVILLLAQFDSPKRKPSEIGFVVLSEAVDISACIPDN